MPMLARSRLRLVPREPHSISRAGPRQGAVWTGIPSSDGASLSRGYLVHVKMHESIRLPRSGVVDFVWTHQDAGVGPVQLHKLAHLEQIMRHPGREHISGGNESERCLIGRVPIG